MSSFRLHPRTRLVAHPQRGQQLASLPQAPEPSSWAPLKASGFSQLRPLLFVAQPQGPVMNTPGSLFAL